MKIVFTSYVNSAAFDDPAEWLKRIRFHTGIPEELAKKHNVESIEQINYEGTKEQNGVIYHFLNTGKAGQYFPRRLNRYIRSLMPDVVFVNGFVFPLQLIQLRFTLGKRVKIVVINHAEKPGTGRRGYLQRIADRYVQHYLFTSKEMGLEWVKRGIISREHKIAEVMEASSSFVPVDKKTARYKLAMSDGPVFLFVGRLDDNKDPLTVLKAFAVFAEHQPAAKLYMIYHTEERKKEVIAFCDRMNLLGRAVVLIGKRAHEEMQDWYSSADFIISASHYEGSGVAVCEAMSCGCIPILTNIPSFRSMTGHGKAGYLYEPGDGKALLKLLLQTETLNTEAEQEKTLRQFKDQLSFEAIAKKIDTIINSL